MCGSRLGVGTQGGLGSKSPNGAHVNNVGTIAIYGTRTGHFLCVVTVGEGHRTPPSRGAPRWLRQRFRASVEQRLRRPRLFVQPRPG